jgi:hypothetical protein
MSEAIEQVQPQNSRKSHKSPSIKAAVVARRVQGESKSKIARDLRISRNTVTGILEGSDIEQFLEAGRDQCARLNPKAVRAVEKTLDKGDGALGLRFLEGVGVLGPESSRRPAGMFPDVALMQSINVLLGNPSPTGTTDALPATQNGSTEATKPPTSQQRQMK